MRGGFVGGAAHDAQGRGVNDAASMRTESEGFPRPARLSTSTTRPPAKIEPQHYRTAFIVMGKEPICSTGLERRSQAPRLILAVLIFLLVSDYYRLVALIGGTVAVVWAVLVALVVFVLVLFSADRLGRVARRRDSVYFVLLFGVWPIFTIPLVGSTTSIEILLKTLSFLVVFVAGAVLNESLSRHQSQSFLLALMAAQTVGAFASMAFPVLFAGMAAQADATLAYDGRAFGLQLQPNTFAAASLSFYLLYSPNNLEDAGARMRSVAAGLLTFAPLLASGSRFFLLVFLLVLVSRYLFVHGGRLVRLALLVRIGMASLLAVVSIIAVGVALQYLSGLFGASEGDLLDRITHLFSGSLGHSGDQDGIASWAYRRNAQDEYISLIERSPLLGYGVGAERLLISSGSLAGAAHSTALSLALQFGVLFPVAVVFLMFRPLLVWRGSHRNAWRDYLLLVAITLVSSSVNHGLYETGVFFFVVATGLSNLRLSAIRNSSL